MKNITEEAFHDVDMDEYASAYSEDSLWDKIRDNVTKIGLELIYKALQLYYVTQSENCPPKVKAGIYAALGYLISPIDLIPDFTPVVGYSDDAVAIGIALVLAHVYITDDIKAQAKDKIKDLFGDKALVKLETDDVED